MKELTVDQLIEMDYLSNDSEGASELELSAHLSPNNCYIEYHLPEGNVEVVCHIDVYRNGSMMIITEQGLEHVGEYDIPKDSKIKCDIYVKID